MIPVVDAGNPGVPFRLKYSIGSLSIYVIDNLGMEKRPRRFSLPEAFFEGTLFL